MRRVRLCRLFGTRDWRGGGRFSEPEPIYMNVEEQHYLAAEYFKSMRLFQFLVRPAAGEGNTAPYFSKRAP